MRERVQQCVANRIEAVVGFEIATSAETGVGRPHRDRPFRHLGPSGPLEDCVLAELNEDAFAPHLVGGHPFRRAGREGDPLHVGNLRDVGVVAWRVDPSEAGQRLHESQTVHGDHLADQ